MSCSVGSGIGTGPGVIEDCYNPTLDRHRMNPRFIGHNALNVPLPQQFNLGGRPLLSKPNQVTPPLLLIPSHHTCICLFFTRLR